MGHYSGVVGVCWSEAARRWSVEVGISLMGTFAEDELELAIACREEARALPIERRDAVREKYKKLRKPTLRDVSRRKTQ